MQASGAIRAGLWWCVVVFALVLGGCAGPPEQAIEQRLCLSDIEGDMI